LGIRKTWIMEHRLVMPNVWGEEMIG